MRKFALRPVLFVLLLALSVFSVGRAIAATILDLGTSYSGATHSHTDPDNELVGADFTVDAINRSTFTGVFDDGGLAFTVRGTVTRTGKVNFNGTYNVPEEGTKMTIKGSGQLSATGGFFLGTANELGKWKGERFKDSISFAFQNDGFVEELGAAGEKAGKSK